MIASRAGTPAADEFENRPAALAADVGGRGDGLEMTK
jgi:hypothetical protein